MDLLSDRSKSIDEADRIVSLADRRQSNIAAATELVRRVLIVDDSRLQRKILSSSLKRWGFEVLEADSGEAALEICRQSPPDIVLSDWMMPGMSGLEFCTEFRALPGDDYGYFILLTSKSDKDEIAEGLDSGADDFLTKPVNGHELRARIAAGERILRMQRELTEKNRLISDTLAELQRIYDSLDCDLLQAKKLQQSLVKERHRRFETGELSLLLRSSGHVGGDLVGYFPAGKGHLGLYAIDVSGHGISSALMTARLAGYLSSTGLDHNVALTRQPDGEYRFESPAKAVEVINDLVLNEMETEHYFTLMLVDLDLQTGKAIIAQAGHPHPIIQRADGTIVQDGPGGFPVGLLSGVQVDQFEVQLNAGDRLLILSDGVTECPDIDGNLLGEAGLETMLRSLVNVRGSAFMESLIWKVGDYAGGRDFPDDISGILFEFD